MLNHHYFCVWIADMTLEDVRNYETHLQEATNRRVVDGIDLDKANQTAQS